MWTVPLRQLLLWIDRPIDFLKIDAQGMDVDIVTSGGDMLHLVRRVLLEVVSDDCKPVYTNQPRCSEVVKRMRALGFEPLAPIPCSPPISRQVMSHFCELEYVFVNARAGVSAVATRDDIFEHHNGFLNGCTGTYDILAEGHPFFGVRNGKLRHLIGGGMVAAIQYVPGQRVRAVPWYYRDTSEGDRGSRPGAKASFGKGYLCPNTCFAHYGRHSDDNGTHVFGVPWQTVREHHSGCPF